jgi:hypothetical protein
MADFCSKRNLFMKSLTTIPRFYLKDWKSLVWQLYMWNSSQRKELKPMLNMGHSITKCKGNLNISNTMYTVLGAMTAQREV